MEAYHWFLLGIMVALTPSLIVLGLLLARTHDQPADSQHSGEWTGSNELRCAAL